jgi:hypothetical protein
VFTVPRKTFWFWIRIALGAIAPALFLIAIFLILDRVFFLADVASRIAFVGLSLWLLAVPVYSIPRTMLEFDDGARLALLKSGQRTATFRRDSYFACSCALMSMGAAFLTVALTVGNAKLSSQLWLLSMAGAFGLTTSWLVRRSQYPIILNEDGLLDPRLTPRTIPWRTIASAETAFTRGVPRPVVIRCYEESTPAQSPADLPSKAMSERARLTTLSIGTIDLAAKPEELAAAIEFMRINTSAGKALR